jgi:hypothetical protein
MLGWLLASTDAEWLWKSFSQTSTLAGLEAALRLVDHVDAALAAHEAVITVPPAQRFQ